MKLAVLFDEKIHSGGGFQQSLNDIIEVSNISGCEVVVITIHKENLEILKKEGIEGIYLSLSAFSKIIIELRKNLSFYRILSKFQKFNKFELFLQKHNVDLVYFISPSLLAYACETINFIFTIWDVAHRDCVELPEVRKNRQIEYRDELYFYVAQKSSAIIVDSPDAKNLVSKRYLVDRDRVFAKSFSPSLYLKNAKSDLEFIKKKNIKQKFLFYPAQFWPHKNHIIILDALKVLKTKGILLDVVFSGGDQGNIDFVRSKVVEYKLEDQVHFVGFISSEELRACYENCLALIMPTLFGPTNIPPLEAYMFNRPIIYTFTETFIESVGKYDYCFPIKWNDCDSVVSAIHQVLSLGPIEKKVNDINKTNVLSQVVEKFKQFQRLYK